MHLPKLTTIRTICKAILDGNQIQIVVNVKNPVTQTPVPEKPRAISQHYTIETTVRTSRHQRSRWAPVPLEVPAGKYRVVFYKLSW